MKKIHVFSDSNKAEQKENPVILKGSGDTAVLVLPGFGADVNDADLLLEYINKKGYTVLSPRLRGYSKNNRFEEVNDKTPEEWLEESKGYLKNLFNEYEKVIIVGLSFGGNLAVSLASNGYEKIRGIVTMEMPVFFTNKISFMMNFVAPIFELFGIDNIKKRRFWYRRGYKKSRDHHPLIPIRAVNRINSYVKKTREELKKIKVPFLVVQAEKSDLIKKKSSHFIMKNIQSEKKELIFMKVDNHDFDLMDEEGKILMLEQVYKYISSL